MSGKLLDISKLSSQLLKFADERHWQPFHTPRNLMLALTGEVGELAEIFQWLTEEQAAHLAEDTQRYTHLQEELADVFMYLVRLADITGVGLDHAVLSGVN